MKKLLIAVLSVISISVVAQTKVTYGAKIGANASRISDLHGDSGTRVGGHIGGFVQIPLQEYDYQFYVQPELVYSMMGENAFSNVAKLDYLTMPILFKAYFSEKATEFFGEIGPQLGYLISESVPAKELVDYKSFDYGLTLGLGFSYERKWEVNARFYYGFTDIAEGFDASFGNDPKNVNSNVNIGVAYIF